MVNSDNMDSEYATNDFIKRTYYQYTGDDAKERAIFRCKYRQMRKVFCADSLKPLNDRIPQEKHYTFGLKNSPASALENNLMIYEDEIAPMTKNKLYVAITRAKGNVYIFDE